LKYIIAELDRIAKYLEDMEEPWALNLAYRVDNCTQQLEDKYSKVIPSDSKLSSISKNVLEQYLEDMAYLSKKENNLTDMIKKQANDQENAEAVYNVMKNHFGKLGKKDSIRFIKKVLENLDK
jgi:predicted transcriptional regulator